MEAPPGWLGGEPLHFDDANDEGRAERLARRRGSLRRALIAGIVVVVVGGAATFGYLALRNGDGASSAGASSAAVVSTTTTEPPTTTTVKPTTTTTLPNLAQPPAVAMPAPGSGLGWGSRGPVVAAYEARMKQLHFDPGPVDGVFDQDTEYAVVSVQKYYNLPRTGRIDFGVQAALSHFQYKPAEPNTEPDRVEIDLDRQVITVFAKGQPILITTTSTGSGEHFCGGVDGCQYAITPTGHFHFYELIKGWQKGKLGTMWNPYYFNGSEAIHGLQSVPAYPASHGCARIPMYIANYFYLLVHQGESVFVVGTPMKAGNGYVGPARNAPTTGTTATTMVPTTVAKTTVPPTSTPTTAKKPTTTTVHHPPTTTPPTTA